MLSTKERLMHAAVVTVAERGIENAGTAFIAKAAGCSEAMIYKLFTDKTDLLNEVFLSIDRAISLEALSLWNSRPQNETLIDTTHRAFQMIYRRLLTKSDETLFLLRFRYSSLYTSSIRSKRYAYNGAFDAVHSAVESYYSGHEFGYSGFVLNYLFELTLTFAEKVLTGRFTDSKELENRLWRMMLAGIRELTGNQM